MRDGKGHKWDRLIVFLISFVPRLVLIYCFAETFLTPMDEVSTLATGAYFGGRDWTALTKFAKYYYGGGYSILFAPFYRLIGNSVTVYYIVLSVCAALQSISAPISYTVMEKFLKIDNRKYLLISSVACSFMVVTRAMMAYNEHILIGCVWVLVWILCKLVEDGKYKAGYSVALMIVLSYMLTSHTRAKVIWIAFVIVAAVYYALYKKWLVSPLPAIISGIAGYFLAGKFNHMVMSVIWGWEEGKFLRNISVNVKVSLSDLKDPAYWEGIFAIISGQINTVLIFTGGIAAIFVVLLVYFYCDNIKTWFLARHTGKQNREHVVPDGVEDTHKQAGPYIMAISLLFLLCAGATIAAQSITWLPKVAGAMKGFAYASNEYGYKALTYVRYMGPFLGPVFLCGAALAYHKKDELRRYLLPSGLAVFMLQVIWGGFILPHIYGNRETSEVFIAFGRYDIQNSTNPMGLKVYLPASIILIIIFIICCICYYRKKILLPVALVLCLFGYEYAYGAIHWDSSFAKVYASRVDAGTEMIKNIEADERYREELPEKIYVYDSQKRGVQKRMYTYQIWLDGYAIIAKRPKDNDRHIVFSDVAKDDKLISMGYLAGQMDDNEYVYVNDPVYQEMFEEQGVTFYGG